jgi:hypothetical protein
MPLSSESQVPTMPKLFDSFCECKTRRQTHILRIARVRSGLLRPLRFLWRIIK